MKKVVIIGPESTGKSTLSKSLAEHYNVSWVPEYARSFLLSFGKNYAFNTLELIAKGQLFLEEHYVAKATASSQKNAKDLLIVDTDMYVMKVWCEFVFGKCHNFILDEIVKRKYDLYLLCKTDLPWVQDELREYPDLHSREVLYHMYRDCMINQQVPWVEISGQEEERLQQGIAAIDRILM